ncbi:TetR/AcrR family transcriptional regulator [Amycolatopsis sp. NPDC049688]|uniref:TetR/AcrR family transcriptional regulator n=1 Tax=Amycolatopsis sp. NPDC049688 TaxID=3154733 RepID=UPI00342722D7
MLDGTERDAPSGHGWPEKRQAIARAAIEIFVREGFARTSVAGIAAEAGVSKRTLYKHYGDKERLFLTVVEETLTSLRDRFVTAAKDHLGDVPDPRAGLIALGRDWIGSFLLAPDLVALRRLLIAEGAHYPQLVEAWRRTGPDMIQTAVEEQLSRLHERGLLCIPDVRVAVDRLSALLLYTANNRVLFGIVPISDEDVERYTIDGVDAFLGIYGPRA